MDNILKFVGLACLIVFISHVLLFALVLPFVKDCPECRTVGRIYKNGVDYICPTCKGTRSVNRSLKEWMNERKIKKTNKRY